MDIFSFRNALVEDYASYVRSFIQLRDQSICNYVDQTLNQGFLWPEPLIQLNPSFESGDSIDSLIAHDFLHPECSRIFRINKKEAEAGEPLLLRKHQSD